MGLQSITIVVEPKDRKAFDPHVTREQVHRRRCDDMKLYIMPQPRKRTDQWPMHVKPMATKLRQRHIVSLAHQADRSNHRMVLTIWRNASSGKAFSEVVRTLPSLPSINVKRAATASSGAS